MEFETGKSKSLEDITLDDSLEHPIWVWALDEEGVEGQDETWQKPVLGETEVTPELIAHFLVLNIPFKVVGTELLGSGDYDHERGEIGGFAIWQDGEWKPRLRDVEGLGYPVEFEAALPICGRSGVRFVCNSQEVFTAIRVD